MDKQSHQPTPMADYPVAPDDFAGHPDLLWFGAAGQPGPAMARALNAVGATARSRPMSVIADLPPITADCVWLVVDTQSDRAALSAFARYIADEQVRLVVETPFDLLDCVEDIFEGVADRVVLVAPDDQDLLFALAGALAHRGSMLHAPVATERARQIEQLQGEVQRISRMLARIARDGGAMPTDAPDGSREPPSPFIEDHVHAASRGWDAEPDAAVATLSARDVRQVIRQRRLRDEFFDSELFADPAWDMLLDLYAARLDRGRVSVSSLCIAAAVPATTALRWIRNLTDSGIFIRTEDPHDGRRIFVALSDDATAAMHRYFARLPDIRTVT